MCALPVEGGAPSAPADRNTVRAAIRTLQSQRGGELVALTAHLLAAQGRAPRIGEIGSGQRRASCCLRHIEGHVVEDRSETGVVELPEIRHLEVEFLVPD